MFDDPEYVKVLEQIGKTAKDAGKAAGILLPNTGLIDLVQGLGYTFVAAGADGGMVMTGLKNSFDALKRFK